VREKVAITSTTGRSDTLSGRIGVAAATIRVARAQQESSWSVRQSCARTPSGVDEEHQPDRLGEAGRAERSVVVAVTRTRAARLEPIRGPNRLHHQTGTDANNTRIGPESASTKPHAERRWFRRVRDHSITIRPGETGILSHK
jgi:hypothetical protein